MPRTVTAHLFSSVNGVSESPHLFQFDAFGDAEGELMGRSLTGVTDVIMGRRLWEEWSQYWPFNSDDAFGDFINPVHKHVISSTLAGDLGWNSRLVDGDPIDYVRALAASDAEGGIIVAGGIETVRSLFLAGAIDTLTLTIHPAVTGGGRRLFDDSVPVTRLDLADHTITPAGNAVLTYSLRRETEVRAQPRREPEMANGPTHDFTDGLYGWITHTDLVSTDQHATRAWCADVLGWTFAEAPTTPDSVHLFAYSDLGGGAIRAAAPRQAPSATPYVHVPNTAEAFEAAVNAGAEPIQAPTKVMDGVCTAIVRAPGGIPIGFSGPT